MSKVQRIRNIIMGVVMILAALLMIFFPEGGYYILLGILGITLIVEGIRSLIYYFTMGRHMVGGAVLFIKGVLILDLGLFTISIADIPKRYIMIYLLLYYVFSGVIDILRAMEIRKTRAPHWVRRFVLGVILIAIAVAGMIFSSRVAIVVLIFSAGLIYSGVLRLINAFRQTALAFVR